MTSFDVWVCMKMRGANWMVLALVAAIACMADNAAGVTNAPL